MHRTDDDGHVGNLFSEGDAGAGVPATKVSDTWLNAVQEEICGVVEGAGIALVKGDNTQLLAAIQALAIPPVEPGGRLTLTSGEPVTSADVDGAATVYYSPYRHNLIQLFNGAIWVTHSFAELSQALSDATKSPAAAVANTAYDLFVWNDGGTLRLSRGPAYTAPATRNPVSGTLTRLNGRWVNTSAVTNGPAAQRGLYVGTIRVGAVGVHDSPTKRFVWNTYNRVSRVLRRVEAAAAWTQTVLDTWRQANANADNKVAFVVGLVEDAVSAELVARCADNSAATAVGARVAFGTGAVPRTDQMIINAGSSGDDPKQYLHPRASIATLPGIGLNEWTWLERIAAISSASVSWEGTFGDQAITGISGTLRA